VIELVSDLGGGKTTFVRGLVRGMGSHDHVASPTFTISRIYSAGNHTIHHFDFYRLHEAGLIGEELTETLEDPHAVTIVEWADVVKSVLPHNRLTIMIQKKADHETDSRHFVFSAPEALGYLIEEVRI